MECSKGIQRRAVTCHRVNRYGWIDPTPTEGCPMDQKPVGEQICKLRECHDKYYWTTGLWRKVSIVYICKIVFWNITIKIESVDIHTSFFVIQY